MSTKLYLFQFLIVRKNEYAWILLVLHMKFVLCSMLRQLFVVRILGLLVISAFVSSGHSVTLKKKMKNGVMKNGNRLRNSI